MKRWLLLLLLLLLALPVTAQVPEDDPDYPPHYATDETFALVSWPRVNLRTAPDTISGVVVDIALAGERFPIVGTNEDETWYLIESGGGRAWIFADLVLVANPDGIQEDNNEPSPEFVQSVNEQVALARNTVGVTGNLNIRSGPGTGNPIVGRIPRTGRVFILGRNFYGAWFYVNYNGTVGWVSGLYLAFPPGFVFDSVPVVG